MSALKKKNSRLGQAIGLLLQGAIGLPEGGFIMDESGHPVEDYAEQTPVPEDILLQSLPEESDAEEAVSPVDRFFGIDL
ncbi:MAG: hypothetical protein IJ412_12525 [Oscillospiraceae bacterium]|nr:hypothetical protein [Oscillospiraceae bacterium]